MCAIGGVSFAPGSKINRHRIASALLREGEIRGDDAAGYAWVGEDGSDGIYKKPVKGSVLNTSLIPRDAAALIIHTRNGTHGSARDNDNNHPVLSPSGDIRLVHNGVISNHEAVRAALGKEGKALPDVDSSVIPAVIEKYGLDGTDTLRGYASAAWFDRETGATIHLARFKSSPVNFAYLRDGSFVFASTDSILAKALKSIGLDWVGHYPQPFDSLGEGDYLQLLDGSIIAEGDVDFGAYDHSASGWQSVTSGASKTPIAVSNGSSSGVQPVKPTPTSVNPVSPVTDTKAALTTKGSEDTVRPLVQGPAAADERPLALLSPEQIGRLVDGSLDPEEMTDREYDTFIATGKIPERFEIGASPEDEDDEYDSSVVLIYPFEDPDFIDPFEGNSEARFFARSHDGDYTDYLTLRGLLSALSWHSGLTDTENLLVGPEEGNLRWVNHFSDIGFISDEPEDGDVEYSWVSSPGNMEPFTGLLPSWVRDGCDKLRHVTVGN